MDGSADRAEVLAVCEVETCVPLQLSKSGKSSCFACAKHDDRRSIL
jgi:hypothetical protein